MKKLIALALVLISAAIYAAPGLKDHGEGSAGIVSDVTGAKPSCAIGVRGSIFITEGASGAADVFQVCLKDAANAYGWVTK